MADLIYLIPLFPLAGVVINGILMRGRGEKLIGTIGSLTVFASFVASALAFRELIQLDPEARIMTNVVFPWISSGALQIPIAFQFDPLSAVMCLTVSGVAFLIHVYSIGYMHGEYGYRRYFTYLNLFVFAMLMLVLGNNFVVMFVGWEGVGLCSYLLIGYWYEKKSASDAGKKAFIVNRVGDVGFIVALMAIFATFGSFGFDRVFTGAPSELSTGAVTAINSDTPQVASDEAFVMQDYDQSTAPFGGVDLDWTTVPIPTITTSVDVCCDGRAV